SRRAQVAGGRGSDARSGPRGGAAAHMGRGCRAIAGAHPEGYGAMSRPLKFLHLTTFYPPHSFGGDALFLYRLCNALGEEGHHVDVVHCVDSYHLFHPGPPPLAANEHPNVRRHELRSGLGWLSPFLTQQTGRPILKRGKIRRLLRDCDYDVIHYHNTSLLGPGVLAMDRPGMRAVKLYTTHEHWLVCPMHVLWKFDRAPCEKPE